MKSKIILDTSPLVAFIDKSDHFHQWTTEIWNTLIPPLLTCETVIAESCFLLKNTYGGESAVLSLLEAKVIKISISHCLYPRV